MHPRLFNHEGLPITSPTFWFRGFPPSAGAVQASFLDRTTAANLREVLSSLSLASNAFEDKCRVSCKDKGVPNAERGVASDRAAQSWGSPVGFFREIHVVATIHESVFSSFDLQLTGIIQIALS